MKHGKSSQQLQNLRPGDHLCFFFETDEEHRTVLTLFLRQGLERGEKLIYLVNNRSADKILDYLRDDGLEPEPFLSRGQLVFLNEGEVCLRQGKFDPDLVLELLHTETEKALAEGFAALRITGEAYQAWNNQSRFQNLIEYETAINEFLRRGTCLPLCQYDRRRFNPAFLLKVLTVHPLLINGTEILQNYYFQPLEELQSAGSAAKKLARYLDNLTERQRVIETLSRQTRGLEQADEKLEHRVEERTAELKLANEQLRREIGERRQAEAARKAERQRFFSLFEEFPPFIYLQSPDHAIRYANSHFREHFGEPKEIRCYEVFRGRREPCEECTARKVLDSKSPYEFEFTTPENRTYQIYKYPFADLDGSPLVLTMGIDITERYEAEAALKESEQRFRQLVEHAADAVFLHDKGKIIEVNQQACESLGYTREELLEMSVSDVEVGLNSDDLQNSWDLKKKSPITLRGTYRRKDGSTFPVEIRAGEFEYDGRRLRIALARDITERLQAEEALRQSGIKYRTLVEAAPLGISIIAKNGRYTYLNPKFEEMFGYTLDDIRTGRVWFTKAYPDSSYRQKVISDWKEEAKAPQLGEIRPRTFRVRCKDGAVKVINFRSAVLPTGDWLMFYEDITERVQTQEALAESEEKYRLLVNQIPAVVFKGYADGKVDFFDHKIESLTGYKKEDFDAGRLKWTDLILPEDAPGAREAMLKALEGSRSYVREYRIRKQDGDILWIQGRGLIFLNAAGRIDYISGVLFDISERKQAEEDLRQSEIKYRTLVEQIPAVTYIAALDEPSTTMYVSPQIEATLGFSPADYAADPDTWKKQLHPDDRDRVLAEVARCQATGEPFSSEYRMVAKDGRVVWFHDEAWVVRDAEGHPLFLQGVMLDITKRKELEEALRKSEEKYRLLVSQIPATVFRGYADWSIDFVDRKIEQLTGYAKEDFDARRLKWCDLIPAEEMDYVKQTFVDALKTNKSYVREHRIRKKSGDYAWVQCRGQIFCDPEGQVEYISGVTFDITERKRAEAALRESEKLYRLLAENVSDVIWTADLNLRFTYISPSVKLLRGFTPEEVLGQRIEEILTPASLELARKTFAEGTALEKSSPDPDRSWTLELEQLCKDGSTVWTELRASFLRDDSGRPVGILGVTRDISKRKHAELALRRRETTLETVSIAAEKFLQTDSWEQDIQDILRRLGQSAEVSRVYIFENHLNDGGELLTSQRYEWVAPGIEPQIENPQLQNLPWRATGFSRWEEELSQGRLITGHIRDFPVVEQEFLAAQNIKSIAVVPIFIGQHWWGMIGFDACQEERSWSLAELEALKLAANLLGAAIYHEQAEKAVRNSAEKLRSLTAQLITAQEKERKRLAAELHDELGHALLALKLSIRALEKQLTPEQVTLKRKANKIIRNIGETLEGVRRLYLDLSPGDLEDLGLTTALHNMVEEYMGLHPKIKWMVRLDNLDGLFTIPVATAIYRVVQEALTNIGKHAKAKNVSLLVKRRSQEASITIEDDGRGFAAPKVFEDKKSLGLLAMEERVRILGGTFQLWSQKNHGTRISITIPFPEWEG